MARPLSGHSRRRTITLSLSPEAIAVLDQLGPNRSQAAEKAILLEHRFSGAQTRHPDVEDLSRATGLMVRTLTEAAATDPDPEIPVSKPAPKPDRKPRNPVSKQETIRQQLTTALDAERSNCTHQWANKGWATICNHCGTRKTP